MTIWLWVKSIDIDVVWREIEHHTNKVWKFFKSFDGISVQLENIMIIYLLAKTVIVFLFKKVPAGKSEGETYAGIP